MTIEPYRATKISDEPIELYFGTSELSKFLFRPSGAPADKLYRYLVEHHMKKNSLNKWDGIRTQINFITL